MNYLRDKIVSNKKEIRAYYERVDLPMPLVCNLPDPPEMSEDYMVDCGALLNAARLVINAFKRNESYRDFVSVAGALPVRERAVRPIEDGMKIVAVLEQAEKARDAYELRKRIGTSVKTDADADRIVDRVVKLGRDAMKKRGEAL